VQCTNCQEYGHTRAYCSLRTVCVVCGDFHNSANCPVKKEDPKNKQMRKLPRKLQGRSDIQGDEGPHATVTATFHKNAYTCSRTTLEVFFGPHLVKCIPRRASYIPMPFDQGRKTHPNLIWETFSRSKYSHKALWMV